MRRALFISTHFPADDQAVHGVFRRIDIHVAALCQLYDQVDLLFLTGADERYSEAQIRDHEARLRHRWSPRIRLRLAPVIEAQRPARRLDFVRGIFSFGAQSLPSFPTGLRCAAVSEVVLAALQERPDAVFAHRLGVMSVLASLPRSSVGMPVIFDLDDVEHRAHARRVWTSPEWSMQRLHVMHVPAILLAERKAARRASVTLVCSDEDRRHMERWTGLKSFRVVRNAVPIPLTPPPRASAPAAVFVGMLSYRPNAEAADLLVREIWPRVREKVPQAALKIVGKRPEAVRSYGEPHDGVSFLGFVDDIEAVYREAQIVCCPIAFGSGTRVKIVEAAAYGRPVVSTPLGAEGLEFEKDAEILLPESTDSFVEACVRLLGAPEQAEQLGQAAYRKARFVYGREAVTGSLVQLIRREVCTAHRHEPSGERGAA